jgi:5'-nucleotidase
MIYMEKIIVYIDMDGVLCDYYEAHQKALFNIPSIAYPQSQYGFYTRISPIEGGISAFHWMEQHQQIEPYILTAPSIPNPLSYTEKRIWVENHLGLQACERLIICNQKNLLKGHYLIDDQDSGRGQEKFEGELWQFGTSLYPNWHTIVKAMHSLFPV